MAVIGQGENKKIFSDLDFKLRKLTSGDINKVYDEKAVNQALFSLFNTFPGERSFNRAYGSRLPYLLFEPFDYSTANDILEEIQDAIKKYEPRVEMLNLDIDMDFDYSTYNIDMEYKILSTVNIGNFNILLNKK